MTIDNTVRVSTYLRTSTDRQERDKTIKTQRMTIKQFLDSKYGAGRYEIIAEYADDGYTGTNMNRPMLQQMLRDSQTNKWEVLVSYDSSRLSRDFYDGLAVEDTVMSNGKLIFYTDGNSPNGRAKIVNRIMAAVVDDDRERIVRKFQDGKKHRASQGRIMNSVAAYGYTLIPMVGRPGRADYTDTQYVINPQEAEVVKLIFHLVGNERYSARQVITKLIELGIKPRKSERGIWAHSSIYNILNNEVYLGRLRYGSSEAIVPKRRIKKVRKKNIEKTSRRIKPRSEWQFMNVPAILEGQDGVLLFQRAQEQLRRNKREAKAGKKPHKHLLSNRIKCSCGYSRNAEGSIERNNLYYRCSNRVSNFPEKLCGLSGIRALDADAAVWDYLSKLISTPETLYDAVEAYFSGESISAVDEATLTLNALRNEEATLLKGRGRLELALQRETLPYERFEVLYNENKESLRIVQDKLQQIVATGSEADTTVTDPHLVSKILLYAPAALREMPFEGRRELVLDLVTRIIAQPGELSVEGSIPLIECWNYDALVLPLQQNKAKIPSPFYYVQYKTISRNCRVTQCW